MKLDLIEMIGTVCFQLGKTARITIDKNDSHISIRLSIAEKKILLNHEFRISLEEIELDQYRIANLRFRECIDSIKTERNKMRKNDTTYNHQRINHEQE